MTSSLRSRLLLRTTLALAVLLAATAGVTYALVRATLVSEFDRVLTAEANAIVAVTERDGKKVHVELESDSISRGPGAEGKHYYQMWNGNGKAVEKSPTLDDQELPRRATAPAVGAPAFEPVTLPDGNRGRAVYVAFQPRNEDDCDKCAYEPVVLAVARDTGGLERTLARLGWLLFGVAAAAVVTSAGLMAWVIRRGLRPLGDLARSIERVGVADLSERIEPGDAPAELIPVVQRLNELLARLADAVAREKAFTADVAHELRTPLAGLETVLEVCASRPRESSAYVDVVRKCLRATRGMHAMVDALLLLARADSRQLTLEPEHVELEPFVHECVDGHRRRAELRDLSVEIGVNPPDGTVVVDRGKLLMVLNNLVDNAVTYCDDGGSIDIAADAIENELRVNVSNTAKAVAPGDVEHVFDRFWRGDVARGNVGTHCGLGLSLCRKLAEVMGGTISARVEGGTFIVELVIPSQAVAPVKRPAASTRVASPVPAGS